MSSNYDMVIDFGLSAVQVQPYLAIILISD